MARTSTRATLRRHLRRTCATTASFSSGFSEHVLYTTRPPPRQSCRARSRISTCVGCRATEFLLLHVLQIFRFFRSVPSPLQGTSARTRWNLPSSCFGRRCALWQVTTSGAVGSLLHWCTSICALLESSSFASTRPWSACPWLFDNTSSSCPVLEPGAAHISASHSSPRASRKSAGTMLTASCRVMSPLSTFCCSHACSSLCRFSAPLSAASWNALPAHARCSPRRDPNAPRRSISSWARGESVTRRHVGSGRRSARSRAGHSSLGRIFCAR
mmetsp:Transcript_57853/g.156047  ORF Transcript_57853/g.156047 Transcript_57853/m.156047 type:complete len:272 (+) Transcript_57853:663-1478(+)